MENADTTGSGTFDHSDYEGRSRATQSHILQCAVEVLIEHGYSGASTLKIQKRAGVSRGRLLHHYPHRDALLVAAVQHIAEIRVRDSRARTDWPRDPRERVRVAIDEMWQTYHRGHFWAATELWLAARHNAALSLALAPREQVLGVAIRAAVDEMFGDELTSHPRYAPLRDVLNTSMRGVALTYSFAPRDWRSEPQRQAWRTLALHQLDLATES